jgi:UDP-GlcNAc:undecaprenyl-phosphate GlcNAc-1-phosphate transferase
MILAAIVLAAALSFALNAVAVRGGLITAPLDLPNERSLHTRPVPRAGGIGVLAGLCAALLVADGFSLVVGLAVALAALSLVDDWGHLPALVRLSGHLGAAAVFCLFTLDYAPLPQILLIVAVGWMTNLYNFMDGADGLAGGMAVAGFGTFALAAAMAGDSDLAAVCACIASAALGFLWFNRHPARIFLGDVGSIPLGFLAAALGVLGEHRGAWPWWFAPVVFAPFVVDASVTLLRRLARGEKVWLAHRSHYYQRLVLLGWGHRRTAFAEYALMGACGAVALLALGRSPALQALLLALPALLLAAAMVAVDRAWSRSRHPGA